MLQGPALEGFNFRFLDFGQRQVRPRPVVEKLLIAFPVKLDGTLLFRLGGADPLVKRGLKLTERRNVLAWFFGGRAIDCGSGSSRPAAWRIMRARAAAAIDSASRRFPVPVERSYSLPRY